MRYVVAAFLFLLGVGTIAYAGWRAVESERRLSGEAVATIVEVEEVRRNEALHRRAKMRFRVDGEEHEAWSAFEASAQWSVGDPVPVQYDPEDPDDASMEGAGQRHVVSLVLAVFGFVFWLLSILTFALARGRARRAREEPGFLR